MKIYVYTIQNNIMYEYFTVKTRLPGKAIGFTSVNNIGFIKTTLG